MYNIGSFETKTRHFDQEISDLILFELNIKIQNSNSKFKKYRIKIN